MTIVYIPVYRYLNQALKSLITVLVVSSFMLALTSLLGSATRNSAQEVTEEEIEEIHKGFLPELEKGIRDVSAKFNLSYGQPGN